MRPWLACLGDELRRSRSWAVAFAAGASVVYVLSASVPCWGRADVAPSVAPSVPSDASSAELVSSWLTIRTRDGPVRFAVELAETAEQQERGLMYRRNLATGAGMLFDFGEPRVITMWMENTYIPLDMLFIDEGGVVAGIARNTKPLSRTIISSRIPVRAVLEINAGAAAHLGIRPGDRVDHAIFRSRPSAVTPPAGGR